MNPVRQRVIAALGAGVFGQAVTIGIQIASLPLFLHFWGAEKYGVWLMLSALPAYLSMGDVGLITAAGNEMTMACGRRDTKKANVIFQSAFAFVTFFCLSIGLISLVAIGFLTLPGLNTIDRRWALAALSVSMLFSLFGGLSDALLKASHRNALGIVLSNITRLAEWLGWIGGLLIFGSFAAVAIGGLIMRTAGLMAGIIISTRGGHGMRWGFSDACADAIRRIVKPAFSFMIFPLSNALSFQGMTLLVGHLMGPATVAMFNAYRTLARVAVQFISILSHSLWPEFSRLFGEGGAQAVVSLYKRSALLCAASSLCLSIILYALSPIILRLWTHAEIAFRPSFMMLMLAYAAIGGAWHVPRVMLMATNRHAGLAWVVVCTSLLSLGLTMIAGSSWSLLGVGAALIISESLVAAICVLLVQYMLRPVLGVRRACVI